ncbi:MAG: hypothetical protein V4725_02815 [Bacteroidota bacterium]
MKTVLNRLSIFLLLAVFALGCKKESPLRETETTKDEIVAGKAAAGNCRMTMYDYYNGDEDYHNLDYYTYKNGLLAECSPYYGWKFTMEYDQKNKIKSSKVYEGDVLLYTIVFEYKKDKVVKEVWYLGNTSTVDDEVFIQYTNQGSITSSESFIYGYRAEYTYTDNGSIESWLILDGGLPALRADYKYTGNFRNPYLGIVGPDHAFWFTNSAFGRGIGQEWYSSEKITTYDPSGNPVVLYDLDPTKTSWVAADKHFPAMVNYSPMKGSSVFYTGFTYENCNGPQAASSKPVLKQRKPVNKMHRILHGYNK